MKRSADNSHATAEKHPPIPVQTLSVAGQLAATVMHEINNPLEAIVNLNFLVQREPDNPEQVRRYSHLIEEQLRTLTQIARQTLSFCKPNATIEEIAAATLAEAGLRIHQKNIVSKRIHLRKELPNDVAVEVNPGEMLEVISNLIGNAVDALGDGGTLCLRAKRLGDGVYITVADDGPGIPETIADKIFDPFFTTKKEKGTGLGLAISKAIVERHRGKIRSRSSTREGRSGTAFRISLPLPARRSTV